MPGSEAVSTLHWLKNDILSFFKFLQKKVSRLVKNTPENFCINLGVVIWKNHVAKHLDSFNKCRKFLLSSQETCFCRNLKNDRTSFLDQCNVEAASSIASSAQKMRGLRVVNSKNFSRATSFVFWVFLNNLPMKQFWRKSAVWACFKCKMT